MTEYIVAGPHVGIKPDAYLNGYKETRPSYEIEDEIAAKEAATRARTAELGVAGRIDEAFSFRRQLGVLAERFKEEELAIVEGGCGYAGILYGIKKDALELGVAVTTTGIDRDHDIRMFRNRQPLQNVDTIILGGVEDAYAKGYLPPESAHFIVDVRGALYYDSGSEGMPRGSIVLPLYAQMLKFGGRALLWANEFDEGATWRGSSDSIMETDRKFGKLLIDNNLCLVWTRGTRGMYGLVEKVKPPRRVDFIL